MGLKGESITVFSNQWSVISAYLPKWIKLRCDEFKQDIQLFIKLDRTRPRLGAAVCCGLVKYVEGLSFDSFPIPCPKDIHHIRGG